jgi:hypothetical protein
MRRLLVISAVLVFLLNLFFVVTENNLALLGFSSNVLQNVLALCAVIGFWLVYLKVEKRFVEEKKGWLCVALAFSLFFLADAIWTVFETVLHLNVPIGSVPDFFYLLAYVVLMWGMYYFISSMFFRSQALNCAVGGLTVLFAGLFFYSNFLQDILAVLFSWTMLVQKSYGFLDILLLGLVLMLVIPLIASHNRLLRSWLLFGLGVIALAVFDLAFAEFAQRGLYYSGHPLDLVYCLSYLLFVFAAYYKLKLLKNDNPYRD